jgi:hypothetical protein
MIPSTDAPARNSPMNSGPSTHTFCLIDISSALEEFYAPDTPDRSHEDGRGNIGVTDYKLLFYDLTTLVAIDATRKELGSLLDGFKSCDKIVGYLVAI